MSDSDLTTLIAEALREKASPGHSGQPGTKDDGQLWGAFPNSMTLDDLAAHVAAVLSGVYAITPLPGTPEFRRRVTPFADEQAWIYGIAPSEARFIIERGVDLARAQETPQ